jgi:hypothetical protein
VKRKDSAGTLSALRIRGEEGKDLTPKARRAESTEFTEKKKSRQECRRYEEEEYD